MGKRANSAAFLYPHQCADSRNVIKRHQIFGGEMDAAFGLWSAQRGLVAKPVNIHISFEGIDRSPQVEPRFQPLKPKDTMHNASIRKTVPGQTDWFSTLKDGANGITATDLLSDSMKTQRGLA